MKGCLTFILGLVVGAVVVFLLFAVSIARSGKEIEIYRQEETLTGENIEKSKLEVKSEVRAKNEQKVQRDYKEVKSITESTEEKSEKSILKGLVLFDKAGDCVGDGVYRIEEVINDYYSDCTCSWDEISEEDYLENTED